MPITQEEGLALTRMALAIKAMLDGRTGHARALMAPVLDMIPERMVREVEEALVSLQEDEA